MSGARETTHEKAERYMREGRVKPSGGFRVAGEQGEYMVWRGADNRLRCTCPHGRIAEDDLREPTCSHARTMYLGMGARAFGWEMTYALLTALLERIEYDDQPTEGEKITSSTPYGAVKRVLSELNTAWAADPYVPTPDHLTTPKE